MGLNIDLTRFGAPSEVECPHCNQTTYVWYDDYDIEGTDPRKNVLFACSCCEKEFKIKLEFSVKAIIST